MKCAIAAAAVLAFALVQMHCDQPSAVYTVDTLYVVDTLRITDTLDIHDTTIVHDTVCPMPPVFFGAWTEVIPPIGAILPESMSMTLEIEDAQSRYHLSMLYVGSGDTAMTHYGTWSQSADTVILTPSGCAQMDSTTRQLVPLDSCSTLAVPAAIDTTVSPDT